MLVVPDRAFLESLAVAAWMLDGHGAITFANGAAAEMAGVPAAAQEGWAFADLIAAESRAAARGLIEPGSGEGQCDLAVRAPDGGVRWGLFVRLLPPEGGRRGSGARHSALTLLAIDITDRTHAESGLRQTAQHYRVLTDTAQDHIFVIDADDTIEFVNRAGAAQFRTTPGAMIGRKRREVFPPEIAERQWLSLKRVFESGEPFYVENPATYAGGDVWLSTSLAPVKDDHGRVRAVLGVSRDFTERKRLEQDLSNAAKLEAIGRLAGGIAHDFNNNLTAILGYVEIMRGDVPPATPLADDLREVQLAAERAAGLVRRLLAFGRKQMVQPRSLDVTTVINHLVPVLRRLIGERIEVRVDLAEGLYPVTGDPGEIEQIVMNLALNARDAMPRGGTLTVSASNVFNETRHAGVPAGPRVLVSCADTGVGMDRKTRERVFDPFFTTKPVGEGTGLGLSTVYGIVKQLEGFIWVESEVGKGSTFYVSLPASDAAAAAPAETEEPPRPAAAQQGTVLLVEDEATVLRFARTALELHGFRVLVASTAAEALAIAASGAEISLLLTDVVMPRMSGPELATELRRARPGLAVLYMSGYPAGLVMQEQLEPTMRLISKPFRVAELVAAVTDLLPPDGKKG